MKMFLNFNTVGERGCLPRGSNLRPCAPHQASLLGFVLPAFLTALVNLLLGTIILSPDLLGPVAIL